MSKTSENGKDLKQDNSGTCRFVFNNPYGSTQNLDMGCSFYK